MSAHAETIGQAADRIDNLLGAMQLPLAAATHLEQLRAALPKIRNALRLVYIAQTGEDPWATLDRSHLEEDRRT